MVARLAVWFAACCACLAPVLGCGNQSVHISLGGGDAQSEPGDIIVSWSALEPGGAAIWFASSERGPWNNTVRASRTAVLNNTDADGKTRRVTYVHHATITSAALARWKIVRHAGKCWQACLNDEWIPLKATDVRERTVQTNERSSTSIVHRRRAPRSIAQWV